MSAQRLAQAYGPRFGSSSTPSSGSRSSPYHQAYLHEAADQANANEHELLAFVQDRSNSDHLDLLKIEMDVDLTEFCFDADA